jgi:hypothetical protein
MEYLIIWLAIAGACAYFASQKGRSALGWFVIGFLLSFIALIILWVLPSVGFDDAKSQEIARKFGVSSLYRKCPECAELVQREAAKCKHCQAALPAISA